MSHAYKLAGDTVFSLCALRVHPTAEFEETHEYMDLDGNEELITCGTCKRIVDR